MTTSPPTGKSLCPGSERASPRHLPTPGATQTASHAMSIWAASSTDCTSGRCARTTKTWGRRRTMPSIFTSTDTSATTQGIRPFARLGQTDSLERVAEWITERINLLDGFLGYNSDADDVQEIASGNQEGTRLVIKDGKTYVVRNGEVFLVDGRRVK